MRKSSQTVMILLGLVMALLGQPAGFIFAADSTPDSIAPALEVLKQHPATLRAENMQVALLLRGIGRQAGVNIVVADTIQDTISLDMEKLSLYDLFQVVVDAKQLRYYQKNNVVFVEKRTDPQSDSQEFVTERLCTKYGSASALVDQLTPMLTQQGSIVPTNRGNCIVVRDQRANLKRLRDLITALDQPSPQVHIEARIVTISTEAKKRLGIIWGYNNYKDAASLANKINPITTSSDLSVTDPSTSLAFGFIRQNVNLNFTLQAMQDDNLLNILSAPSVLVLDGNEAEIKQGKEIPYVTQTSNVINTTFREANLGLKVKPTVLDDGLLSLKVVVTNDSVDPTTTSRGDLLINKQAITTNLLLEDQVTIVIGGIVQQTQNNANAKVPGLGDIPLFGNLFKNTRKQDQQSELMVFIKPHIVPMGETKAAGAAPAPQPAPAEGATTGESTGKTPSPAASETTAAPRSQSESPSQ